MTIRQSLAWQAAAFGVCSVASLLAAPHLPARVPLHWGISGQPDGWGSPAFSLWFGPIATLAMIVLTVTIPLFPGGKNVGRFGPTYGKVMLLTTGLMSFNHLAILHATWRGGDMPRTFLVGLFLFFALLGNLMGKVRQNPYVGVRTPWTLKDERVWEATHRRAAWLFVGGGLLGALMIAVGLPFTVAIALILVISFAPILDSYLIYKKLVGQ